MQSKAGWQKSEISKISPKMTELGYEQNYSSFQIILNQHIVAQRIAL